MACIPPLKRPELVARHLVGLSVVIRLAIHFLIPPIRGASPPTGRQLARDELQALMTACAADTSVTGRRDAALLAVAYAGGLRRAELAALALIDADPLDQGLLVRRGKGRKARRAAARIAEL